MTVGQNAISQVRAFQTVADVSGLIVTKLDGSAKGGIVIALLKFGIPVHAVGVGEARMICRHLRRVILPMPSPVLATSAHLQCRAGQQLAAASCKPVNHQSGNFMKRLSH